MDIIVQRLQTALWETQEELRTQSAYVPWLIGALRHISQASCAYGMTPEDAVQQNCACYPCTARGALQRYKDHKPIPKKCPTP